MINEYITSYHLPQLAEAIRIYVDSKTNEIKSTTDLICVTYEELVNLRNNSLLKPGCFYCITDYVTTTGVANTESAGYNFPIIVLATSSNTLSEEAVTTNFGAHSYFEDSNLDAWKIWYCLDNDDDRFSWAGQKLRKTCFAFQLSSTEWFSFERDKSLERIIDNTTYYGYKWESGFVQTDTFNDATILWYNVEYPELTITYEYVDTPVYIENNGNLSEMTLSGYFEEIDSGKIGKGVIYRMIDEFGNDCPYDFKNILFKRKLTDGVLDEENGVDTWCYTFNAYCTDDTNIYDASVISRKEIIRRDANRCYGNIVKEYSVAIDNAGSILNDIVFLNIYGIESMVSFHCFENSFGNSCSSNTFGNNCYSNTFGNNCYYNTFGNSCSDNSFGTSCSSNTFGNNCHSNTFGNSCSENSFGYECNGNSFGNSCSENSFGNYCNDNTFGNNCYYNTFGNNCSDNSFGNNCNDNSFGNYCYYNSFGNSCNYNSFRNSASTTSTLKDYCNYNHFDDGCSYNVIWNSDTTSSSIKLKNVNINRGVSSTGSSFNTINIDVLNQDYEIQVAKNSNGEIKIYCEADLIP